MGPYGSFVAQVEKPPISVRNASVFSEVSRIYHILDRLTHALGDTRLGTLLCAICLIVVVEDIKPFCLKRKATVKSRIELMNK